GDLKVDTLTNISDTFLLLVTLLMILSKCAVLLMWWWLFPQVLGDRWANICRWTEDRWILLQDILLKWQRFTEEQCLFSAWLSEKEDAVTKISSTDFKDQSEMISSLQKLT
ncbi:Dystrophin, partial [Galemys pyrenaicus]